jgi:hypothetical protein
MMTEIMMMIIKTEIMIIVLQDKVVPRSKHYPSRF